MGRKLYVGNLAYTVTDGTLEQSFGQHGTVQSAQIIMDRDTGRSKGFGFVEMGSDQEAQAAITALNLKEVRRSLLDRQRSTAAARGRARRQWRRRAWRLRRRRWRRAWRPRRRSRTLVRRPTHADLGKVKRRPL